MRLILVLMLLIAPRVALADRVALVIGNGDYSTSGPLPNARNDASDMAARLRGLGFTVFEGLDRTRPQTLALIEDFADALQPDDLALFYYAGHGAQIGTENYIIPVETSAADEAGLADASIRLQTILRTMELRADTRIVILDACRNNPFVETLASRAGGAPARGLARVEAGVGSYIAFSTQPGNVALDGSDRNSPFTGALRRHIGQDGDIHAIMRAVRAEVVAATGQTQVPWENSSLVDEVFLAADTASPQLLPKPDTRPGQIAARMTEYHYVGGLTVGGDGFLALRSAPWPDGKRLARMPADTRLEVLGQDGPWMHVRLLDGQTGWAHSDWIRCCVRAQPQPVSDTADVCNALWYARNKIWAEHGYCFKTDRAIATFGTEGCTPGLDLGDISLSRSDRAEVDRLLQHEARAGCD